MSSAMAWWWPGGGARVAAAGGGTAAVTVGATPAVAGRFGALAATAIEAAATNLAPNPSLEVDAAGYASTGTGAVTVARSTVRAHSGVAALRAVCDGTANRQGWKTSSGTAGIPASASTAYTVSAHVAGSLERPLLWSLVWWDGAGAFLRQDDSADIVLGTSAFARTVFTTTSPAGAAYLELRLRTSGLHAVTFDTDAVQVEAGSAATSYCDGLLGSGYAWSGTPHASASTRAAGGLRVDAAGCLAGGGARRGTVAVWWRPGAPASAAGDRTLLRWGSSAEHLDVTYRDAGDRFRLTSQVAGASADVVESAAQAFAAQQDVLVVAAWDERRLQLSVDGGAAAAAARIAGVPPIAARWVEVGWDGASAQAGGGIGPVLWFSRPLTPAEVTVLARLARAPRWQEVA